MSSLPLVIIFERHWDETPKQLLTELIPQLANEGYDTFCMEAPHDMPKATILSNHNSDIQFSSQLHSDAIRLLTQRGIHIEGRLNDISLTKLRELMQLYVSSKKYHEVALRIKHLPASQLLKETFERIEKVHFRIEGVDIAAKDFHGIFDLDDSTKMMARVRDNEEYRMRTITDNLLRLFHTREGTIFHCGVFHAHNLISSLKDKKCEKVLYYFPYSPKFMDDSLDDIRDIAFKEISESHAYRLASDRDRESLAKKIVREIKAQNQDFKCEILGGTSHTSFLSEIFKANFTAFLRPGHYVDALVNADETEGIERIKETLQRNQILTREIIFREHNYVVVPEVNTQRVHEKIHSLKWAM